MKTQCGFDPKSCTKATHDGSVSHVAAHSCRRLAPGAISEAYSLELAAAPP